MAPEKDTSLGLQESSDGFFSWKPPTSNALRLDETQNPILSTTFFLGGDSPSLPVMSF